MKNKAAYQAAARDLAQDCIVTQALGRFLEQVLEEVYETRIKPLEIERDKWAKIGWEVCRKQVYALSEHDIEKWHGKQDLQSKEGAYARGICLTAKGFARALNAFEAEDCDILRAALNPKPVDLSGPDGVADGAPWWADGDRDGGFDGPTAAD